MKVQVVPVGRVNVVAQVESWVGDAQLHVGHPARDPADGSVVGANRPLRLGRERVSIQPQAGEPGLGEGVVVVPRHQHRRAAGERSPDLLERRPGDLEGRGERALAQLDHVAQ